LKHETTVQEKEFIETVCRVIDYGNGIMHLGYRMKGGVKQLIEINPHWSATSMFYRRNGRKIILNPFLSNS